MPTTARCSGRWSPTASAIRLAQEIILVPVRREVRGSRAAPPPTVTRTVQTTSIVSQVVSRKRNSSTGASTRPTILPLVDGLYASRQTACGHRNGEPIRSRCGPYASSICGDRLRTRQCRCTPHGQRYSERVNLADTLSGPHDDRIVAASTHRKAAGAFPDGLVPASLLPFRSTWSVRGAPELAVSRLPASWDG
jgi:hypothetical protein